jgi:hypothetical protein
LDVANFEEFPAAISRYADRTGSQMVILPWSRGPTYIQQEPEAGPSSARNPFDGVFHRTTTQDQTSSTVYSEFIRNVFLNTPKDVALFVDRGVDVRQASPLECHLFLPFIGGPDDRLALSFLVQLCNNSSVTATVVYIAKTDGPTLESQPPAYSAALMTTAGVDTVYGNANTQTRMASDTADNLLWARYTNPSDERNAGITGALGRITFSNQSTPTPLHTIIDTVNNNLSKSHQDETLIVLAGRSRRLSPESHRAELTTLIAKKGSPITSCVPKTLGDVGAALVATNVTASLLIVQASIAE